MEEFFHAVAMAAGFGLAVIILILSWLWVGTWLFYFCSTLLPWPN